MNLQDIFREIESVEFSAYLSVVSGLRPFWMAISEQEVVHNLIKALKSYENVKEVVLRIYQLSQEEFDTRFSNPKDKALAVYMWVLSLTSPGVSKMVANTVLDTPQIWWARKVTDKILADSERAARDSVADTKGLQPKHER